jgi:hypothetical protein
MDRKTVRELRQHLEEALEVIHESTGFIVTIGSAGYVPGVSCTFKVELSEEREGMPAKFRSDARALGLDPAKLWQGEFVSRGETFIVHGINCRARKYPVQAVRQRDGASYKFPVTHAGIQLLAGGGR